MKMLTLINNLTKATALSTSLVVETLPSTGKVSSSQLQFVRFRSKKRQEKPRWFPAEWPSYVVERVKEAPLCSEHRFPSLRRRHFVYETLPNPHATPKIISVYLTSYVEDLGRPGEIVDLEDDVARKLILTRSGVYASPENLKMVEIKLSADAYSSKYVGTTVRSLSSLMVKIPMNMEEPWAVEPWHVRAALRLNGVHVPEKSLSLPDEPVTGGPDNTQIGKEFEVKVMINNKEVVAIRCQITQSLSDND